MEYTWRTQTSILHQCQSSGPRWSRTGVLLCDYLQERKSWSPTNYFLYGVFDHGWYESGKMLITLFRFLQNASARSSLIQFHGFTCNQNGFRPLKIVKKHVSIMERKKNIIKTWTLDSTQEVGRKKRLARCFKKWESYISVLKKASNKNDRIFSLAWNIFY